MNEPTTHLETRPEVSAFVERVRDRLSDLGEDEREELVGGLEADIDELVSDGGSVAELGDPRAYADELRAAAGIAPGRPGAAGVRRHRGPGEHARVALDTVRARWDELVQVPALRGAWGVLVALRPVWWVARAWAAVELFDLALGTGARSLDLLPTLGPRWFDTLVLLVAVVLSVQVGRGRIWPGSGPDRSPASRIVLAGLNVFAGAVLLVVLPLLPTQDKMQSMFDAGFSAADQGDYGYGLPGDVENVFPYDSSGAPLTGVQLFDQKGRPLSVGRGVVGYDNATGRHQVVYPWLDGGRPLFNVFPLPSREQRSPLRQGDAWSSTVLPDLPRPPLVAVPPATLPLPEPGDEAGDQAGDEADDQAGDGADRDSEEAPTR